MLPTLAGMWKIQEIKEFEIIEKMKMQRLTILWFLLSALIYPMEKSQYSDYPISAVSIKDISINDDFWLPKIELIQDVTIRHALDKCDQEGRLENFLVAGGKMEGSYKGKMPFDDTDVYKIIEGASYSLISKPNPELDAVLDSVITIIETGQEPDGYLTTWFTIDRQHPPAWWVKPSTTRWKHLESSHELYNSGHLFEAATAHYRATGKRSLLDIALKNADLLVENFEPRKLRKPPGHQIVETGLIQLYHITKNIEYLELAKFFLDLRGDSTTHALYGEYSQDHLLVTRQTEAVGHAVRALYMYAGMTDIAALYRDQNYLGAVHNLWENTYHKKMYITGGLGSRREGEAFGDDYELPNLTAYNETCAAIASVYWNHRLFRLTGHSKYYDIIERTLYNGLISGISLDGKKFFYPNPTESDGTYKFNMGSCTRQPWFDCSCCPTNLIRFIPSIPTLIYAVSEDSLYMNLFVASRAHLVIGGQKVGITQETDYPWDGYINISVYPEKRAKFTLKLRLPGWAQGSAATDDLYSYLNKNCAEITLKVNGQAEKIILNKGYAEITRKWKPSDKVELVLPMNIRKVVTNEKVIENRNKVAFEYGPIVYCAEEIDNRHIADISISDDTELKMFEKRILSERVMAMQGKIHQKEFTLVPYYLWSNRGVGKMKVWFPRQ